jgi:ribonuclease Z
MRIFLTHMHADHILGLPGMLQTLSFMGRTELLEVYGPKGTRYFVDAINRAVRFQSMFPLRVRDIGPRDSIDCGSYRIQAANADHTTPCLAFRLEEHPRPGKFNPVKARRLGVPEGPLWRKLQSGRSVRVGGRIVRSDSVVGSPRPGAKLVYAVDTRPCLAVERLSRGVNLLIHDSTFAHEAQQRAIEFGHSTCTDAAALAKHSRVERLALVHVSAMYDDPKPLLRQARRIFAATILPEDMTTITRVGYR